MGPVLIACAIVAVLAAADYWVNTGKIYRGVEVGSVSLGGETPAAAREIVRERALGELKEIELGGPERFTRTAAEMGVNFNVGATVEEAYAVGREGNVLERLQERLRATLGGITIPPDVDYRSEKARAEVGEIAARVNHEPREASLNIVGSEVEVLESREGYKLDDAATLANVDRAVEDVRGEVRLAGEVLEPEVTTEEAEVAAEKARRAISEQVVLRAEGKSWTLSPADIGSTLDVTRQDGKLKVDLSGNRLAERLANVYDDLTVDPVEAGYDLGSNGIVVTQSREGQSIESEKLLGAIEEGVFEGKREYEVPIEVNKPEFTTAEAEEMKPTELQGSYRTDYRATSDQGQTRVENLKIASGGVSGSFVAPGETFSMIDHVAGLDYNETKVIVNGQETKADGGGLCQVTSTLYNAALYAGLEITERTPHYAQLPYIRPGMDATVWYGDLSTTADDLDMTFKNTTDGYVLLEEYVADDGYIYANVYGVPDKAEVRMSSEPIYITEDSSKWVTYYTRTDEGKIVYEDQWTTDYGALIDEKGQKIPIPDVPVAEVDGTYLGPSFSF